MLKSVVTLNDYNPSWEQRYEDEKVKIIDVTGDQILAIEHIGSTSIKGMGAKPIIDIMVGVKLLDEVDVLVKPLSQIGYEYVPKIEWKDRKFFRKGLWGQGTCHLHICEFVSNEWNEKILFRNYLRTHPKAAEEYYELKRKLATKYRFDRSMYTKSKEPYIQEIIQKAKTE